MASIIHPLLALLASLSRQELARQVTYLRAENQILRSKLPDRITLSNQERRKLVRHGKKLGARIKEVISIVSYSTFRRWVRQMEGEESAAKPSGPKPAAPTVQGRPKTDEDVRELIIRIRTETGWGYTKIRQALNRLGHKVSRQTVSNVLKEAGLTPDPHADPDTWNKFLKRHADTLWQCDFASKRKWTLKGMVDLYFLVFIHIGTRRIWVSPCTANPTADWTSQQARNFAMHIDEHNLPCKMVMRDNDKKYPKTFDDVFTTPTCRIKRNVPASPNLQAHVERVIQTLKHEVLNGFCVVSEKHLDHILRRAADWYNHRRCHSARGNLPPVRDEGEPPVINLKKAKIVCDSELGGHLKSYRAA
jgi:putative transposase